MRVGGAPATNPARLTAPGESLARAPEPDRYVGRGGHKLDAALRAFELDVRDLRVLDAGASTGGFTDCLLQAGAGSVIAVEVGRGQMHQRLLGDPRITLLERTNIREVVVDDIGGPVDLVVGDLSFVSLRVLAPSLLGLVAPGGDLVLLVKPQFEAARGEVDAGRGVIRDPEVWRRTLSDVSGSFAGLGAAIMGVMRSPLRGADGNVEFFLHVVAPPAMAAAGELAHLIDAAVIDGEEHR